MIIDFGSLRARLWHAGNRTCPNRLDRAEIQAITAEIVASTQHRHKLIQKLGKEATKGNQRRNSGAQRTWYCSAVGWKHPSLTKGNIMLTTLAVIALVSLPFVLDLYFAARESNTAEEEYIPDGR
jgi:hypothetical protein